MSAFTGAVSRSLRRRAKAQLGLPSVNDAHVGAVTFIQRSNSALRLNVHAHSLFLDGVYVRARGGALAFQALGAPTFEEVEQVAQWTHARIERVLRAHGRTLDGVGDESAELTHDQPVSRSDAEIVFRGTLAYGSAVHGAPFAPHSARIAQRRSACSRRAARTRALASRAT